MGSREIVLERKLQLQAGNADVAKIAQSLGPTGVAVVAVKQAYDEATRTLAGMQVPVRVRVLVDGSFDLEVLAPSTATLLAAAADVPGGSGRAGDVPAGTLSRTAVRQVAIQKQPELNTNDLDAAERTVLGTARSMGLRVIGDPGDQTWAR